MQGMLDIQGTMPGLNDFLAAVNRHRLMGNKMKQEQTERVAWAAKTQLPVFTRKINLTFVYREANRKRDKDNIAFAKKFILDGLVTSGRVPNDTWAWIGDWSEAFVVEPNNPGITVIINEVKETTDATT
jgi:hypothetical protein